jgi:PPOX class probable F420-dependent enzyme
MGMQSDLEKLRRIAAADHHLAVVATTRADGSVQSSVVNAGVLAHPVGGEPVVAFVAAGAVKKANLRARPPVTLTFRAGWDWVAVEGRAELLGPDDGDLEPARLRQLLRDIFTAAGGQHEDWEAYDATMAAERRTAVLVVPRRVYTN